MKSVHFTDTSGMKWYATILHGRERGPRLAVSSEAAEDELHSAVHISSGDAFLSQLDISSHTLHVGCASFEYDLSDEPDLERLMNTFKEAKAEHEGVAV